MGRIDADSGAELAERGFSVGFAKSEVEGAEVVVEIGLGLAIDEHEHGDEQWDVAVAAMENGTEQGVDDFGGMEAFDLAERFCETGADLSALERGRKNSDAIAVGDEVWGIAKDSDFDGVIAAAQGVAQDSLGTGGIEDSKSFDVTPISGAPEEQEGFDLAALQRIGGWDDVDVVAYPVVPLHVVNLHTLMELAHGGRFGRRHAHGTGDRSDELTDDSLHAAMLVPSVSGLQWIRREREARSIIVSGALI